MKNYPLWDQFIEGKNEWIGGKLTEICSIGGRTETKITDILLENRESDFPVFWVHGEDFSCGFCVKYGGISPNREFQNGISFYSTFGLTFNIQKNENSTIN